MKQSSIPFAISLLLTAGICSRSFGQGEPDAENIIQKADSIEYVEGVSLQQGGYSADPVSSKGLTLSSDLGLTESKQIFGYDALSLNARWVPGTNNIGSRIFLNLGVANWFTPGLSGIYPDTVLSLEERFLQSETKTSWIGGLGVILMRPKPLKDEDFAPLKGELDALAAKYENAGNDPKLLKEIEEEESQLVWELYREKARKFRWTAGGNLRLTDLGESSDIDVFDLYTVFARGKGIWDFSGAFHFISPRENAAVLRNAFTASAGVVLDLDDVPPVNSLTAIFRYGYYNFKEKMRNLNTDPTMPPDFIRNRPLVNTFDATFTFSGLRGKSFFGSGLGFRISTRWDANFDTETEFAILFTSKFVNERKEK